jgi:DNA-binding MarR family transcriptional regulator
MRAVDLHSHRLSDRCGLTGPQLAILREAARLERPSAGELARAAHLSQATLTGILDRLERRGLIVRQRDVQDRRIVSVSVTDMGHAMLRKAPSLLQDRFREELVDLEEWERTMILGTLQRIARMMEAEGIEAAPVLVTGALISNEPLLGDAGRDMAVSGDTAKAETRAS